jgi:hypothetical protein
MSNSNQPDEFTVINLPIRLTSRDCARVRDAAEEILNARGQPASDDLASSIAKALERASALIGLRIRRERLFGGELFGEPAWDILLDLFIQRARGKKTSSTSAALASRAPSTTALRYISMLTTRGWVNRSVAVHDKRVYYIELTDSV